MERDNTDLSTRRRTIHKALFALLAAPTALLGVFLVLPMLGLFRSSFYEGSGPMGSGWTLAQYAKFASDSYYIQVLMDTIGFGLAATLISLVIGFPVGYALARMPPEKRRWRLLVVIMPLTLSLVVVVFGWLVILGRTGLFNTLLVGLGLLESPQRLLFSRGAVLLVLVQQFLPFMILSIMSVVTQISPDLEQASANLRANRFRTFRRVVLPLAIPGILAGSTLVFILTVSAFITPRLIGGSRIQMIGSLIFEQVLTVLNWPFAAALSFMLLALTLGITALANAVFAVRMSSRTI